MTARDGQVPELAPPVVCEPSAESLGSLGELSIPWVMASPPWVRSPQLVAPISADRSIFVGTYGDWSPEGLFVLAYDDDGSTAWDTLLPASAEVVHAFVEPTVTDGTWLVAREPQATSVWRLAADGSQLGATVIEDLSTTSVVPTPTDGLLLVGLAPDGATAFAELSAVGAVLWQGPANLATFDHAGANGAVQRWDDAGALVWEHDPRPAPHPGFPLDVGATWARLDPSGNVVAHGREVGPGGEATRLLGLDPNGQPAWSLLRPYVAIDDAWLLDQGRLLLMGLASECWYEGWFLLLDDSGNPIAEGRNPVLGVDAQRRLVIMGAEDDAGFTIRWVAEVPA